VHKHRGYEIMGYFANATEAEAYFATYCEKCINWTKRNGNDEESCPIWDMQFMDNYELCNVKDSYLDKLIPRSKDGLSNERCVMFLPKKGREK